MKKRIAVIGGGAAGFFASVTAAANKNTSVTLFEKSNKLLAKVRISGGGRCNVTHDCTDPARLTTFYPRGEKELRNAFARFNVNHTIKWFEQRNVELKTEADGRMFPVTDDSITIINCLHNEAEKTGVEIRLHHSVQNVILNNDGSFTLYFGDNNFTCDRLIVTTGGSPHYKNYDFLQSTGHTIIPPVPSLFTFNIPASPLKGLEGVAVPDVLIKLKNVKNHERGPLLVTHWGISGPAVIKLSAWAARQLHELNYSTEIYINWLPDYDAETMRIAFEKIKTQSGTKKVFTYNPFALPVRLWQRLCERAGIAGNENYADINKQKINRIVENLVNTVLQLRGKTTYKEEFVTSGGVSLKEVNMQTMESKKIKGLYFAGEVLDIDGITGGFNFQSAWTTGYLAGTNAAI